MVRISSLPLSVYPLSLICLFIIERTGRRARKVNRDRVARRGEQCYIILLLVVCEGRHDVGGGMAEVAECRGRRLFVRSTEHEELTRQCGPGPSERANARRLRFDALHARARARTFGYTLAARLLINEF